MLFLVSRPVWLLAGQTTLALALALVVDRAVSGPGREKHCLRAGQGCSLDTATIAHRQLAIHLSFSIPARRSSSPPHFLLASVLYSTEPISHVSTNCARITVPHHFDRQRCPRALWDLKHACICLFPQNRLFDACGPPATLLLPRQLLHSSLRLHRDRLESSISNLQPSSRRESEPTV